jgi:hypothetical protein
MPATTATAATTGLPPAETGMMVSIGTAEGKVRNRGGEFPHIDPVRARVPFPSISPASTFPRACEDNSDPQHHYRRLYWRHLYPRTRLESRPALAITRQPSSPMMHLQQAVYTRHQSPHRGSFTWPLSTWGVGNNAPTGGARAPGHRARLYASTARERERK